jgi:hypothetical protein
VLADFLADFAEANLKLPRARRLHRLSEWRSTRQRPFTAEERKYRSSQPNIMEYRRAKYGGNSFRTKAGQAPGYKKDDSNFRMDYGTVDVAGQTRQKRLYGSIQRLFVHSLYPGGEEKIVVEGDYYRSVARCPIAGTHRVKKDATYTDPLNTGTCFTFLRDCYQEPVALWPHDPLDRKRLSNPEKKLWDVIDRNQDWDGRE